MTSSKACATSCVAVRVVSDFALSPWKLDASPNHLGLNFVPPRTHFFTCPSAKGRVVEAKIKGRMTDDLPLAILFTVVLTLQNTLSFQAEPNYIQTTVSATRYFSTQPFLFTPALQRTSLHGCMHKPLVRLRKGKQKKRAYLGTSRHCHPGHGQTTNHQRRRRSQRSGLPRGTTTRYLPPRRNFNK